MDDLKLKAGQQSRRAWPVEGISVGIIMTHTQSIINLACIIRKHESSHVIKVLLVVLLSSLCPDALFVLPAHCWSFTERALIYAAAWLLTYCLYVQSWLIMKNFRRKEMSKLKSLRGNTESGLTVKKDPSQVELVSWFDDLRRSAICRHASIPCTGRNNNFI